MCFGLVWAVIMFVFMRHQTVVASVKGGWSRSTQSDRIAVKHQQTNKRMPKIGKHKKHTHCGNARGNKDSHIQIVGENPEHVFNHLWQLGREINIQLGVFNDRPSTVEKRTDAGELGDAYKLNGVQR